MPDYEPTIIFMQQYGTCWFNSSLNAILNCGHFEKLFKSRIEQLLNKMKSNQDWDAYMNFMSEISPASHDIWGLDLKKPEYQQFIFLKYLNDITFKHRDRFQKYTELITNRIISSFGMYHFDGHYPPIAMCKIMEKLGISYKTFHVHQQSKLRENPDVDVIMFESKPTFNHTTDLPKTMQLGEDSTIYTLGFSCLIIYFNKLKSAHAIAGVLSKSNFYLIDSNHDDRILCNWSSASLYKSNTSNPDLEIIKQFCKDMYNSDDIHVFIKFFCYVNNNVKGTSSGNVQKAAQAITYTEVTPFLNAKRNAAQDITYTEVTPFLNANVGRSVIIPIVYQNAIHLLYACKKGSTPPAVTLHSMILSEKVQAEYLLYLASILNDVKYINIQTIYRIICSEKHVYACCEVETTVDDFVKMVNAVLVVPIHEVTDFKTNINLYICYDNPDCVGCAYHLLSQSSGFVILSTKEKLPDEQHNIKFEGSPVYPLTMNEDLINWRQDTFVKILKSILDMKMQVVAIKIVKKNSWVSQPSLENDAEILHIGFIVQDDELVRNIVPENKVKFTMYYTNTNDSTLQIVKTIEMTNHDLKNKETISKNLCRCESMMVLGRIIDVKSMKSYHYTEKDRNSYADDDIYGESVLLYEGINLLEDAPMFTERINKLIELHNNVAPSFSSITARPIHIIFVQGIGCKYDTWTDVQLKDYCYPLLQEVFRDEEDRDNVTYKVTCNTKFYTQQVPNAIKTILRINLNDRLNYIMRLYTYIIDMLKTHNVVVMGFSYGGSVVSRLAELFTKDSLYKDTSRIPGLYMATFGSIYVPKVLKTHKVNVTHYLYERDIAIICNKLDRDRLLTNFPKSNRVKPEQNNITVSINNDYQNVRFFRYVSETRGREMKIKPLIDRIKWKLRGKVPSNSNAILDSGWDIHHGYDVLMKHFLKKALTKIIVHHNSSSAQGGGKRRKQTTKIDKSSHVIKKPVKKAVVKKPRASI